MPGSILTVLESERMSERPGHVVNEIRSLSLGKHGSALRGSGTGVVVVPSHGSSCGYYYDEADQD